MKKFKVTFYFVDNRTFLCEVEADHIRKACQQVDALKEKLLGLRKYDIEERKGDPNV